MTASDLSPAADLSVDAGFPGVRERSVVIESGPRRLIGTLAEPEDFAGEADWGVVTIHGWSGPRAGPQRLFVHLGRELAARGVPALRFDLGGRGESTGDALTATLDQMIDDALAASNWLRDQGCREIGLTGICSGGNVALGAATLGRFPRLALLSTLPFSPVARKTAAKKVVSLLGRYARQLAHADTWRRLFRGELALARIGRNLAAGESRAERSLKDSRRDILAAFALTPAECLFVYGQADPEAAGAAAYYRTFCRVHHVPTTELVINGANHNFHSVAWREQLVAACLKLFVRA